MIYSFIEDHPYLSVFVLLCWMVLVLELIGCIRFTINEFFNHLNIRKAGWPDTSKDGKDKEESFDKNNSKKS